MSKIKIYHNPRCSKSRETLALLQDKGQQPEVIEYLKDAPTAGDLLEIIDILEGEPASLVRTKEDRYRELKFDLTSKETIAENLAQHPELIERPIVIYKGRAVLGRPPEKVLDLFS